MKIDERILSRAAELARLLCRIGDAGVAEHRRVVAGYDLPVTVPAGLEEALVQRTNLPNLEPD